MVDYRKRQKRERRRAIVAMRVQALADIAAGKMGPRKAAALKVSRIKAMEPVKAVRPGSFTAPKVVSPVGERKRSTSDPPLFPIISKKPVSPRDSGLRSVTGFPTSGRGVTRSALTSYPQGGRSPVRVGNAIKATITPRAKPVSAAISPTLSKVRASALLPAAAKPKRQSDIPRNVPVKVCKARPVSSKSKGGMGSGKAFVPWCG